MWKLPKLLADSIMQTIFNAAKKYTPKYSKNIQKVFENRDCKCNLELYKISKIADSENKSDSALLYVKE